MTDSGGQAGKPGFLDELKRYVGFDEEASRVLREFLPYARPHFPRIVDDFYATIAGDTGARDVITGGAQQIERLKQTLRVWMEELLAGPHDQAYVERRARIGHTHVRIRLRQQYMLTAMNRIRSHLVDLAQEAFDGSHAGPLLRALNQILDLELAIMLETYREDLLAQNRSAERLATIGQFAAGIGHELRNPLGVIESSVFLLRQRIDSLASGDEKALRHLDRIRAEVERSNKTITDLLDLARERSPQRSAIGVDRLIEQAIEFANLPAGVSVDVHLSQGLRVSVDVGQIQQVLVNLFLNASQAMGEKGKITVSGETQQERVVIRVSDGGPGIPRDVSHRVFEPLFTTKARGTGIGLALCRKIVEAHEGQIDFEPPEAGETRGARFRVIL